MTTRTNFTSSTLAQDALDTFNRMLVQVFDVTLFGAVGDGTGATGVGTDNTASINAAVAAAAVKGGIVFFPPGIFRVATSKIVNSTSNVHFRGAGRGSSQLFFDTTEFTDYGRLLHDGGVSTGRINNVSTRDLTVYGVQGVAVSGGAYPGNPGYDGTGCMVSFRATTNFLCDNVECYYSPNYGINIATSSDGSVTNCFSHDHNADGIHVQDTCYRITVANNHTLNTGDDGIGIGFLRGPVEDIVVANNTVNFCGARGIAVFSPCRGVTVVGNTVNGTWLAGILVEAYHYAGVASEYQYNIVIDGNTVRDAGALNPSHTARGQGYAAGIRVNPVGGLITGVSITNNIITNAENGFIWVTNDSGGSTQNIRIEGNICSGINGTGGLGNATIGGGISQPATGGVYPGIMLRNTLVADVSGNIVSGSYHDGLLADAGNDLVKVSGNVFKNANTSGASAKYAISIGNGTAAVSDNRTPSCPNIAGVVYAPTRLATVPTVAYASATRTAGTVSIPSSQTVLSSFDTATDLTIYAVAGEVLNIGINGQAGDTLTGSVEWNVTTVVGGAETNLVQAGVIASWSMRPSDYNPASRSTRYVVQANDVSGGQVVLRLKARTDSNSTPRTVLATTATPFTWDAINLGPKATATLTTAVVPGVGAAIAADTFTRANVAAAVGALGTTESGGFTWAGSAFGITSNQAKPVAVSSGAYPATGFSAGQTDTDVSCDVYLNGAHARIYAKGSGNGGSATAAYLDTAGNLYYYDGTTARIVASFTALSTTSGKHTLRLIAKGNNLTGFIDGVQIGNGAPSVTMVSGQFVGIMDATSNGANAFDNFTVNAAA